jgi:hypothetical protein
MIMDMGLVLMLPLEILMGLVGVFHGRMIVLMIVLCHQVLHLPVTSLDVMGQVDVFMGMDHFFMSVLFHSSCGGHCLPPERPLPGVRVQDTEALVMS